MVPPGKAQSLKDDVVLGCLMFIDHHLTKISLGRDEGVLKWDRRGLIRSRVGLNLLPCRVQGLVRDVSTRCFPCIVSVAAFNQPVG